VVVLNDLTQAGHYILAIGYYDNQRTGIFNDPYGNKNLPSYPNYSGAGACYDWPANNNGFVSLKKVHCFIYCRGGWPPSITQQPADRTVGKGGTATFSIQTNGLGPIMYRWQKNGADVSDGGHYSGTGTNVLTISAAAAPDAADYRCIVGNPYGSANSSPAHLYIAWPDFSDDGDVDVEDFAHLQACLGIESVAVAAPGCIDTDLNGDGNVNQYDFACFHPCFGVPTSPALWLYRLSSSLPAGLLPQPVGSGCTVTSARGTIRWMRSSICSVRAWASVRGLLPSIST